MSITKGDSDRRVRKTRKAVVAAFSGLVQERRYDEIRVGDIVEGADVGRSTFYQHYSSKDDVLIESMGGMLDILADSVSGNGNLTRLERVLDHFWENRRLGRLFFGPSSSHVLSRITRELAQRIELRVRARLRARGGTPAIPPRLIAIQTAESYFGLIKAWLSGAGAATATPAQLAEALSRGTQASLDALMPMTAHRGGAGAQK